METLNLPPMGDLLNSRAGMGFTPDRFMPTGPVPLPITVPRVPFVSATRPPQPGSVPSLAEYANIRLDYSGNPNAVRGTIMTRQERRDLLLSQMARHEEQFCQKFGPQFIQKGHPAYFHQQPLPGLLQTEKPIMVPQVGTSRSFTTAVQPASPASVGRSAESIATHTAGAKESMANSKMPRFVVDNQETIAAKCKHGFGRLPRVATVDLPAAPETEISHATVSASTHVSAPASKASRAAKKEKELRNEKERKGLRQSSPSSVSSSSSRSSVPRTLRGSPTKVTKRRHNRASSSASASSSSASSVSASSLDAITSYIASMPESKKTLLHAQDGVLGRPKARHVSFNVNDNGTQGFTIRGNGTEQSYEICGNAMIFSAVEKTTSLDDDEGRWESLIYGLGPRAAEKRDSAGDFEESTRQTLPSLMEVAELQAANSQRASLDLPPIRSVGPVTHATSVLATMQPSPAQPALSFNSSLSPTLAKMAESPMSEEDAVIEEHIRGLEAAIRAGGAKRKVVAGDATTSRKTVVLIPPETAASVGSLLGVILRAQYCKLREAAETRQEQEAEVAEAAEAAEAAGAAGAAAQGVSLPSISEVLGPQQLLYGRHAPAQYRQR